MNSTDNIHRRYRHIFILPSALVIIVLVYFTSALITFAVNIVSGIPFSSTGLPIILSLLMLSIIFFVEYNTLKNNPLANLRRLFFLSFLSNILWLFVMAIGLPFVYRFVTLGLYTSILILGISVATSFRIVIVKAFFWNELYKALPIALAQPLLVGIAALYPFLLHYLLQQQLAWIGGTIIVAGTIIFMVLLERPGKKYFMEKPSKLVKAFLLAWLAHKPDEFEKMIERTSVEALVKTNILTFEDGFSKPAIVVSDAHPGPFYPVGSSNLPYLLYDWFRNHSYSAMVLHSLSGHDLNLPSKTSVQHLLSSLNYLNNITSTDTCTTPIIEIMGKATVMGIAFDDTVLLTLTMSPYGTEDFPKEVKDKIEKMAYSTGFKNFIIIDSHNSEGGKPNAKDYDDVCKATNNVLTQLKKSRQYTFRIGYSHSSELSFHFKNDIGPAGIGVLVLEVNRWRGALISVDANNAKLGLREALIKSSNNSEVSIVEICTSDTHITTDEKGENFKGYYALGELTDVTHLKEIIRLIKDRAVSRLSNAYLTLNVAEASVKVMGAKAFDNFSTGIDKSLAFAKKGALTLVVIFFIILILIGFM